jgi:hypothetical protein
VNIRSRSIVNRNRIAAKKKARAYTVTPKALAQRRAAQPNAVAAGTLAGKSTGPKTEAGKDAMPGSTADSPRRTCNGSASARRASRSCSRNRA